jgi:hypothetical protein
MKVPTSVVTQSGKQPYSVAVHPTDGTVAVGFADTTAVEIYDARTLARRPPPHLDAVNNGSLQAISWSGDGQSLYAAGSYPGGGYPSSAPKRIKVWDRAGAGPVREIEVAPRIVINLVPCGDGSAFAALGPSFGLLDRNGALLLWKDSAQADMRGKLASDFTVSADAQRVRFGLKAAGGEPVLFDLQAERLTDSPTAVEGLYSPDLNNFPVTDWTNNNQPKLAGTPIQLELNETARSLAVARKTEQFVLGTEFYLRAYDKKAREIWSREAGVAWGVNVAEDVKLVVAAYGDGTIRWHRLADGQELLVLFVHAKDRRWVAWTPKGYYTASPGGESLIGWHLNRSWNDPADFFPVHRFRARFYRPDVVHQVLSAMDEDIAIAEADKLAKADRQERNIRKLLPPVLEIQSPKDGDRFNKSNVSIQYTVRAPAGEKISEVEVYLDDQKISSRGFIPVAVSSADAKQLDLVLPRRGVKVTLVARSGDKASEPRSVRLTWDGITSDPKPQPRLLALLIGVSAYNQRALRLEYAHQDALNLNAALKTQEGKAFLKVETKVLIDADSASIRKGFDWLNETAHEGDLTLILLSGHGTTRNNTFFFLPAEADPANLSATAISGHEIVGTAQGLPGGKLLLIDACRAGGGLTPIGMTKVPVDMNKLANDMGQPVGAIFFGSSSVGEYSYEDSRLKAGAFTAALIEGLSGKADFNDDGKIETDELGVWLRRRVPQLTEEKQHPLRHQSAPVDYTLANP